MIATPTQDLDKWVQQAWPTGVLAIGGCDAQNLPFCRALSPDGTPHISEECWQILDEAVAQLAAHDCGETRSLWVFDEGLLWVVRRPDGLWAGVFTLRDLPESITETLNSRIVEFYELAS